MPRLLLLLLSVLLLPTGVLAAEMELSGLDRQSHRLSEYVGKGRWVVLNVWSPWCPPCRQELPGLVDFHHGHRDSDAMVLGVAIDFPSFGYPDRDKVQGFVSRYRIDLPVLLADSSQVAEMTGQSLSLIPVSFIYAPDGRLVARWNGMINSTAIDRIMQDPKAGFAVYGGQ